MTDTELPNVQNDLMTPTQQQIISFPTDPNSTLQIVSGPGAGKTTTLVHKIAYLIRNGLDPSEILVLSMTNRAVENLRFSLAEIVDLELADKVNIHTFHAYCHKLIMDHDEKYKGLDIIEESGWRTVLQLISTSRLNKFDLERIVRDLKKYKIEDENHEKIPEVMSRCKASRKEVTELMKILGQINALTHPDLLKIAKEYLANGTITLNHKVAIIDEFQDMYEELFDLVKLVARGSHLVVAGDPNQSIYGFLGSNNAVLEDLHTFKPINRIEMKETFRSSPEILQAANSVLKKPTDYIIMKEGLGKPVLQQFEQPVVQYEFIATEILRLIQESGGTISKNDIAVLAKTNAEISQVIKILNHYGIPCTKLSSIPTWLTNELFHLIDYLRIIQHPERSNFPILCTLGLVHKVGPVTIKRLHDESIKNKIPLYELLFQSKDPKIEKYANLLKHTRSTLDYNDPHDIFHKLLGLGYELGLSQKLQKSIKDSTDRANLTSQLCDFQENLKLLNYLKPESQTLVEFFLENYSTVMPVYEKETVKVSTVHSAKGLEFPVVFFAGFEKRWNYNENVLYVGMTRAKNLLYCTGKDINGFQSKHFQSEVPMITDKLLLGFKSIRAFHTLRRIYK